MRFNVGEADGYVPFRFSRTYAAAVDGRRFLAAVRANDPAVPPIQLIVNWRALLREH
jgi:hypothetical protein